VAAVGADLAEPEAAVVLEAQGDPAPVGRVGAGERVDVAARVCVLDPTIVSRLVNKPRERSPLAVLAFLRS
jgi:hypothetical protein